MTTFETITNQIVSFLIQYGPRLVGAICVFVGGLYATNWISKLVGKTMNKNGLDVSLQSFFISMLNAALKILLLITVAGMLGIETTSFVAIIGALGLAVGLALQGSLSNFAGGVLILVFKPFKVGDLIESQGQTGWVKEIQIFNTILLTPEHKTVILANGAVSNNTIINYSKQGSLRVDLTFTVDGDTNIEKVKRIVSDTCHAHPNVLQNPAAEVAVFSAGEGSLKLVVRPYTTDQHYWDVYFGVTENLKMAFEKNGVKDSLPTSIQYTKEL